MTVIEQKSIPEPNSGCWIWDKGYSGRYGAILFDGKRITAHHASHLIYKGPVPKKWHVDHLCKNPACVNPDHLEAVPCGLNIQRAHSKYCKRGHLLEGDNIIKLSRAAFGRRCKTCHRENMKRYRS